MLLRRFLPMGIRLVQAAPRRPARSLNSSRYLNVGGRSYGALVAAALAGFFGVLCFKKKSDCSAGDEMRKEKKPLSEVSNREKVDIKQEVGINTRQKNNGSGFSLEDYLAEMTKVAAAQKRAREVSDKTVNEVTDMEVMTEEDEAAMKARFEDWMKEYGRTYKSEEEKARRYKIFKTYAKIADKATANARGGARFITNHTADWTDEEFRCLYGVGIDWDDYLDEIKYFIDKKRARDAMDVTDVGGANK